MTHIKAKIKELCGIDLRSLALFRIGLALLILVDLFIRLQDLDFHYTDEGSLPRNQLIESMLGPWEFSLHLISGTWLVQLLLFGLAAISAVALLVGYHSRLATVLAWVFTTSLQARNPLILQGGDDVLRLLLFWAMFLPLGAHWSFDQYRNQKKIPFQIASVATLGLLLQICFIYWFTALLKSDPIWRTEGSAVWYALSLEQFSTPLGMSLLNYPSLLTFLSFATLYLEAFGPFFAFSPIFTPQLRLATAAAFIIFHFVGLRLTMELGFFTHVCTVAWLVFIPGWFWDKILKKPTTLFNDSWRASWLSNVLAALCIGNIFLINLETVGIDTPLLTYPVRAIDQLIKIEQHWGIFSPFPLNEDGWFVIPGKLADGTKVDLYKEGKLTWEKPALISASFKNYRWRSYLLYLYLEDYDGIFLNSFAQALCRRWNNRHPPEKQLVSLNMYYMLKVNKYGQDPIPNKKVKLLHYSCGNSNGKGS